MDVGSIDSPNPSESTSPSAPTASIPEQDVSSRGPQSKLSAAGITSWAKNLKLSQSQVPQGDASEGASVKATFARFTSGLGLRLSPKSPSSSDDVLQGDGSTSQAGNLIGTITKGLMDTSKNAVKAVQVKARHAVSQNKRRYQEGGFDLDMTYITENIIAMGFPAGDMSSGFLGYFEGFYRNHMEEVIKFFETHHKDKYKVYNLCSERLYDASLFEGKVACFPFDDHNCPPIRLIISFCQSAYSWLKQDIENVIVVHCKAGMARTGLMISSLLLYLKFFPTAEESMDYYNNKRCVDGKGLILPSQIRYVKYFERVLTYFDGENQPRRRCMLRGFRLHRCPYWIRPSITVSDHNGVLFSTKKHPRTKDLSPEDFWFGAPKKGVMVFTLPGDPGLAEVVGDFKVHFHDRQGDFYFWLNTTMMENRKLLNTGDIDAFDKRKLPSPGFQVEVVLVDVNSVASTVSTSQTSAATKSEEASATDSTVVKSDTVTVGAQNKDDVFSDSEAEEPVTPSRSSQPSTAGQVIDSTKDSSSEVIKKPNSLAVDSVSRATEKVSLETSGAQKLKCDDQKKNDVIRGASSVPESNNPDSEFKAMAADASVFSFGDDEEYESD